MGHLDDWHAERVELAAALGSAEANEAWTVDTLGRSLSFQPKRGERIYLVVEGAGLVEHRKQPGRWAGGYSGFSVRVTKGLRWNVGGSRGAYTPGAEEPALVDTGTVTITDRRVVFQGSSHAREWAYSKLLGYHHESTAPITLLHVSNRQRVSGVLYDAGSASLFQLRLATAVAYANGSEAALIAGLRDDLAAHDATRPVAPPPPPPPPPLALPTDAAATAAMTPRTTASFGQRAVSSYRGWPRWARIAAPVFAVLVVLSMIGSAMEGEPQQVVASTADSVESTTTTERVTTTTERSTTTTAAPTTTTAPPTTTTTVYVPPPAPPTTAAYVAPATTTTAAPVSSCHPSYSPCLPITSDLNCSDVDGPITVHGPDDYGLDRDGDGVGCES